MKLTRRTFIKICSAALIATQIPKVVDKLLEKSGFDPMQEYGRGILISAANYHDDWKVYEIAFREQMELSGIPAGTKCLLFHETHDFGRFHSYAWYYSPEIDKYSDTEWLKQGTYRNADVLGFITA